jgi:hypothetical protein
MKLQDPHSMQFLPLLVALGLAAHAAAQQGHVRTADHPLPPTVSFATTSPDLALGARQALPDAALASPAVAAPIAPSSRPRGARPAQASAEALPDAVLFDRPRGAELWAMGHDWKASFDGRGFTFIPFFGSEAPRNFPLRIELASATVGGTALRLVDGIPQLDGNTVRTDRGDVTEVVATGLRAVEQSFVFRDLRHRGAIEVDLAMPTELAVTATADGLRFANEHGFVTYTKAIAKDAAGASLPLAMQWDGDSLHITIPSEFVAAAQLPLVLDPIVSTNPAIAPSNALLLRLPDSATLQSPDRSFVIWQQQWSATDHDCLGRVLDQNLAWATNITTIDISTENWLGSQVASSGGARNFMVVAQVDAQAALTWIAGRIVPDNGVAGAVIDIERSGVVGLSGNNYRPDVGGDPYVGPGAYFNVVWEHQTSPGNRDIHYKLVQQSGALLTSNPSVLANLADDETFPSISKSNWEVDWHIAYQRRYPIFPNDQDIWEARVTYFGTIAVAPLAIAGTVLDELRPCVSSLALPQGYIGGAIAMVAYERVSGGQADIFCAAIDYGGGASAVFNLSANEAGGAFAGRNQIFPEVDTDGVRFVVGYSEFSGTDYDTYLSTLAFDPPTTTFRLDEERVLLGGTVGVDDYWTRISAYHSGSGQPNPRYIVTGADISLNNIPVWEYGGYTPGWALFGFYPTQCGSLTITPSGTPAIGQTISFQVNTALPSGTVFGGQGYTLLTALGCNCILGVSNGVVLGNPLSVLIPANVNLVGSFWSVQGFGFSGANCLGFLDLSDTVDFVVR